VLGKDYAGQDCALAAALEVVGERWTLLIVRDAFFGARRFGEWTDRLDIPRAVLADRLRGLVDAGILRREDGPGRGGRPGYELTEAGRALWPAVHALACWGSEHRRPSANRYRHAGCGTELAAGALCPACAMVPSPEDVLVEPRTAGAGAGSARRLFEPLPAGA
jgi:DNA-binding HxlR family transcriptional regulator